MRRWILLGLLLAAGCAPSPPKAGPARKGPVVFVMSRADFQAAVQGRSQDDVVAAAGRPKEMTHGSDGTEVWVYEGVTTNPETGQPDGTVRVTFRGGRAIKIEY